MVDEIVEITENEDLKKPDQLNEINRLTVYKIGNVFGRILRREGFSSEQSTKPIHDQ